MNDKISRSAIMEIATYVIADSEIYVDQKISMEQALPELETRLGKDHPYIQYLHTAIEYDSTIGDIAILKTSNGMGYSSPMSATCFQDGEDVYIQFRGTPDDGWVQNPISYGADISPALAADKISSQIQVDGMDFFDKCIYEYAGYGFPGQRIVGGHSQGANVGEYVATMSKYAAMIDVCVSLNGPNHSKKLYDHVMKRSGFTFFYNQAEKISSINGHNDYVNMLGQKEFAFENNIRYMTTDDAWAYENGQLGFYGWHDLLYQMNRDGSGILPYDAEQGPVGNMMAEINNRIINLPQEVQGDSSMSIMGILEMQMGSKEWEALVSAGVNAGNIWEFLGSEEFIGFLVHGLPMITRELTAHPGLLSQTLNGLVPPHIKEQIEYNNKRYYEMMLAPTGAYTKSEYGAEVVMVELITVMTAVFCSLIPIGFNVVSGAIRNPNEFRNEPDGLHNGVEHDWETYRTFLKLLNLLMNPSAVPLMEMQNLRSGSFPIDQGIAYVDANPYFKVDTDKLRSCAERAVNLRNRLDKLENDLQQTIRRVPPESKYLFSWVSSILDGCPKLDKVNSYLNFTADRFEIAESRALDFMQPGSGRTTSSRSGSGQSGRGQSGSGRAGSYAPIKGKVRGGQHGR